MPGAQYIPNPLEFPYAALAKGVEGAGRELGRGLSEGAIADYETDRQDRTDAKNFTEFLMTIPVESRGNAAQVLSKHLSKRSLGYVDMEGLKGIDLGYGDLDDEKVMAEANKVWSVIMKLPKEQRGPALASMPISAGARKLVDIKLIEEIPEPRQRELSELDKMDLKSLNDDLSNVKRELATEWSDYGQGVGEPEASEPAYKNLREYADNLEKEIEKLRYEIGKKRLPDMTGREQAGPVRQPFAQAPDSSSLGAALMGKQEAPPIAEAVGGQAGAPPMPEQLGKAMVGPPEAHKSYRHISPEAFQRVLKNISMDPQKYADELYQSQFTPEQWEMVIKTIKAAGVIR